MLSPGQEACRESQRNGAMLGDRAPLYRVGSFVYRIVIRLRWTGIVTSLTIAALSFVQLSDKVKRFNSLQNMHEDTNLHRSWRSHDRSRST